MKPIGITNTSKASSIIALALLLFSGAAGILAFAPASVVAASGPTIKLSASSGTPPLASVFWGLQQEATNITVTGTGFPSGQTSIEIGMISTSSTVTSSTVLSNNLCLIDLSVAPSSGTACNSVDTPGGHTGTEGQVATGDAGYTTVTADANGYFQAVFQTPLVTGSPDVSYNVAATYSTSSGYVVSNSVGFTVTPIAQVVNDYSGANSGKYNDRVDLLAAGFSANEVIQLLPSTGLFNTAPWGGTAEGTFKVDAYGSTFTENTGSAPCGAATTFGTVGSNTGAGTTCDTAFVGDHHSGSVTVQFIGVSSGNTASTTFSITPSIEFQLSGATTFALPAAAGTAKFVGHGFAKSETISANSLTIGGVSTIQSSITAGTDGSFGPVTFTYTSSLPAGVNTATFDGTTFSWANQNIVASPPMETFQDQQEVGYGGVIIATTTAISFAQQDSSSSDKSDYTWLFGSCVGTCGGATTTSGVYASSNLGTYTTALSGQTSTSYTLSSSATASTFAATGTNGQGLASTITYVGTSATATGYWYVFKVPASYGGSSTGTETLGSALGSPPATSLTITMNADANFKSTTQYTVAGTLANGGASDAFPTNIIDNTGSSFTLTLDGFNQTDTSANVYVGSTFFGNCATTSLSVGGGTCDLSSKTLPDLPMGTYTVWVNGTAKKNYGTESLQIVPVAGSNSLSSTSSVQPGTLVGLLTASGAGIHGLAASTHYSVLYSGSNVTSFTSTSTGQVPPGVQFAVPAGTAGNHIVDIVGSSGTSVLFMNQLSTGGQYTNMIISTSNSLTATPSSGPVGSTVGITGSGLAANQLYYVWVPLTLTGTSTTGTFASYTSFTTDASGNIPSGVSIKFPSLPTSTSACSGTTAPEQGTTQDIFIAAKSSDIGATSPSKPTGTAAFFIEGSLTLSNATIGAGSLESVTVAGLCESTNYQIVFNYQVASTGTAYTGTVVGAVASDTSGRGTGTFTVPASASAGSYTVQLVRSGYSLGVLSQAPTLTVGAASTSGLSTNTFVATGSASESTVNGQATISQSFTNSYTGALNVYMWVDVQNSAGQTVGVFLGSANAAAGASVNIGAALFNLPSGSYTAQVFITTSSGIVISKTSTTASFSV